MAMHLFSNERHSLAHTSDTLNSLVDELRAFRDVVARPAKVFISDEIRNINLLAREVDE